jgi:hypothetical protein
VREPDAAAGCIRTVRMRPTALLACAALGGCAADARAEPDVRAGIVVTRDDPSLPAACRPRALATRIGRFLDAVSRGDPAAARFVAPSGGWYSVTEGRARHFVAYERRELAEHLARRHDRGERVRLLDLAVGFANGLGQIEFRLDRRADDLRRLGVAGTIAIGKGAVNCDSGSIVVWSMGMPTGRDRHADLSPCPRPPKPRGAVTVACARRWR